MVVVRLKTLAVGTENSLVSGYVLTVKLGGFADVIVRGRQRRSGVMLRFSR